MNPKFINLAKHINDGKAFVHHAYGLLQGGQGNRNGARFELGLALARESFAGARQRIRRGLALCDKHHLT